MQTGLRAASPFDGRFRFLVALVSVRDLRVYAKHLFGAAKVGTPALWGQDEQPGGRFKKFKSLVGRAPERC